MPDFGLEVGDKTIINFEANEGETIRIVQHDLLVGEQPLRFVAVYSIPEAPKSHYHYFKINEDGKLMRWCPLIANSASWVQDGWFQKKKSGHVDSCPCRHFIEIISELEN